VIRHPWLAKIILYMIHFKSRRDADKDVDVTEDIKSFYGLYGCLPLQLVLNCLVCLLPIITLHSSRSDFDYEVLHLPNKDIGLTMIMYCPSTDLVRLFDTVDWVFFFHILSTV
jgi:hypothetical protein